MASKCLRSCALYHVAVITLVLFGPWAGTIGRAQRVATSDPEHTGRAPRVTIDVNDAPLGTVLYTIARRAGLVPGFRAEIIPTRRVTLHLHEVTATEAFERALRGTGLVVNMHSSGDVTIFRDVTITPAVAGTIVGRVIAATTKQPLRGAKIGLDGTDRVAETEADGSYRLADVSAGSHTVIIRLLGYARVTRTVMVQDNAITTADVALDISATPLDQVVVTGTVVQTELKAVPNAITVITAKQIEERGITHIDQLFHGDVPGLFSQNRGSFALLDQVTMFSRGATAISGQSSGTTDFNGSTTFTNPIKTYVDGVELADPKYLSQIDPQSIERIEILTGPQASTIYGSNAINGVMQIFTKRGTSSTPQLTLNLLSGWVENNFNSAYTPQHDHSAQLNGVESRMSYNIGGSWQYVGRWTPAKQTARTSGFGGMRLTLPTDMGSVTADMTFRLTHAQNIQRGTPYQVGTDFAERGWYNKVSADGLAVPTTNVFQGQTLGLTLGYTPMSSWSHELNIGQDASDTELRYTARGYQSVSDTVLQLQQGHTDRRSLRYTTMLRVPIGSWVQATLTGGADAWQSVTSFFSVQPQSLTGTLTSTSSPTSITITRQPDHNTGGFLQSQVNMQDRLFLTYGIRVEWNPAFGKDAQSNYSPRYGLAYTQDIGTITAKLRASYGRSTRPPVSTYKQALNAYNTQLRYLTDFYGDFDTYLANTGLTPEYQQGGEAGLELYWGTRGSFVVTRYNQTVNGLIDLVSKIDSVRSNVVCVNPCSATSYDADGYGYLYQSQYLNIGSIRNQGWELQGSVNTGPFTSKGVYSWTKSRVIGITPAYRTRFPASSYPQYQSGATFQYLPEHSWAFGVTYAHRRTTLALNVTGTGQAENLQNDFYLQNLFFRIRLPQNKLNITRSNLYVNFNKPYTLTDLTATHQFSSRIEGVAFVQNLTNQYTNDYYSFTPVMGRQTKVGVRCHF